MYSDVLKVKPNLCPRTICDMFLTNSHTNNLRQKDFYQPSFNTVTHKKTLNSIPRPETLEQDTKQGQISCQSQAV